MASYEEFIRQAAKKPEMFTQLLDDPDTVSQKFNLDKEATARLLAVGPTAERITLSTTHDISRVLQALGRLATAASETFTDNYANAFTDAFTDQYTNSNPEDLEIMFGLEPRRSIRERLGRL